MKSKVMSERHSRFPMEYTKCHMQKSEELEPKIISFCPKTYSANSWSAAAGWFWSDTVLGRPTFQQRVEDWHHKQRDEGGKRKSANHRQRQGALKL